MYSKPRSAYVINSNHAHGFKRAESVQSGLLQHYLTMIDRLVHLNFWIGTVWQKWELLLGSSQIETKQYALADRLVTWSVDGWIQQSNARQVVGTHLGRTKVTCLLKQSLRFA